MQHPQRCGVVRVVRHHHVACDRLGDGVEQRHPVNRFGPWLGFGKIDGVSLFDNPIARPLGLDQLVESRGAYIQSLGRVLALAFVVERRQFGETSSSLSSASAACRACSNLPAGVSFRFFLIIDVGADFVVTVEDDRNDVFEPHHHASAVGE